MKKLNFKKTVSMLKGNATDYKNRTITYSGGVAEIFYIPQLTDKISLSEFVIKPFIKYANSNISNLVDCEFTLNSIIFVDECKTEEDASIIEKYILDGWTIILLSDDKKYLALNLKKVEKRSVTPPELNFSLRGPQDCFTENIETNISLVRYRVKDNNLRIDNFRVGKRSHSSVAVWNCQKMYSIKTPKI